MEAKEIEAELCEVLSLLGPDGADELVGGAFEDVEVSTFEEAALLTSDAGLVLRFPSGDEFQVTIVRSR